MYNLYTDGSAQPNPGPCGCGGVLLDPSNKIIWTLSEFLHPDGTNNIGELMAIYRGVSRAAELEIKGLTVHTDSELCVNLLNKTKVTKKEHLLWILTRIQAMQEAKPAMKMTFKWIKAHNKHPYNEMADSLAEQALNTTLPPLSTLELFDTEDDLPIPASAALVAPAPSVAVQKPSYTTQPPPANALYLKCPFAEKDAVKKLGARWSADKKSWYVEHTPENRVKFSRWIV